MLQDYFFEVLMKHHGDGHGDYESDRLADLERNAEDLAETISRRRPIAERLNRLGVVKQSEQLSVEEKRSLRLKREAGF